MLRKARRILRLILLAVFLFVLLGAGTVITGLINNYDYRNKTYIFNTVDDLNFLEDKVVETIKDKHAAKLSYDASRTVKVEFEGDQYSLFAYEFHSSEDTFAFGKAVSGNDYQSAYESSGDTSGRYYHYSAIVVIPISNKLLVFKEKNAIYIETKGIKKKQFNKFVEYLFSNLPQKVDGIK